MIDNDKELANRKFANKTKRKKFNVSRHNTFRQRRDDKDDETFLKSNASRLLNETKKIFDNFIEKSTLLIKNFHRERRMIQNIENKNSQNQTIMNIFQSLEHDIFDSNRKKSIDQTIHNISNFDDENQDRNKLVISIFEKLQQHIFSISKQMRKSKHKNAIKRFILKSQRNTTLNEFATNNAFRFLDHFINSIIVYVIIESDQFKNNINQHAKK